MKQFATKTFNIPAMKDISTKTNQEHLKLYAGYVKNANTVIEALEQFRNDAGISKNPDRDTYMSSELNRRFAFEFNGIRNHELYFSSLEGGAKVLEDESAFKKAIGSEFGPFDAWLSSFKTLAMTRGIGWAMLWYDRKSQQLIVSWVDEHHFGQLSDCTPILALDMWEHAYVADYQPSGKKQYVEDFFSNLNWAVVEKNFAEAAKK